MKTRTLPLLFLLVLLTACSDGQRREMLALLDEADSLNRAYAPLPADSLLRRAADFFDRHGTPNEQVRAHYLLGCAYRDQGQAPEALQAWQDAIDRADTTARDSASLHQMMAVYGQMAELYHAQDLPIDELSVLSDYKRLALEIEDTLRYILVTEVSAKPFDLLGDTTKMLEVLDEARRLYESMGRHSDAVRTLAPLIYIEITHGNLSYVQKLLQLYESDSELFDSDGNIARGCEMYYYFKGLYLLRRDSIIAAEAYMRKLLAAGEYVNAYRGLLELYRSQRQIDSVCKYSLLFEAANDSNAINKQTEVIHQATASYNYQRHAIRAERAYAQMKIARISMIGILFIGCAILGVVIIIFRRLQTQKREKVRELLSSLNSSRQSLRQLEEECELLKHRQDDLSERKRAEIAKLKDEISKHEQRWQSISDEKKEAALLDSQLVMHMRKFANGNKRMAPPTVSDWTELKDMFKHELPIAYALIGGKETELTHQEQCVMILHLLKFSTNEMAVLLDCSPQRVSNIKTQINIKLFGQKNASMLDKNIKRALKEQCKKV